jgi:hypothetical protein
MKVEYLTGCDEAVQHLRADVEAGQFVIKSVQHVPAGIIPPGYLQKCSSVTVAVSGSGSNDYVVLIPERPDYANSGSGKVIDIDPIAFCLKRDDLDTYPTGVALFHQKYDGRTTEITGYDAYTLEETVSDLRSNLLTGAQPLSAASPTCINSITHAVTKLNNLLGPGISGWNQP